MFHSKSILVVLLLAISEIAVAGSIHARRTTDHQLQGRASTHMTNAARMASGLAPLPPVQLRKRGGGGRGGGRGDHDDDHGRGGHDDDEDKGRGGKGGDKGPHPTGPEKPKPSSQPGKPDCEEKKEVKIKCNRKGGKKVGYISKKWSRNGDHGFGLCNDRNDALEVDFRDEPPFDITISKGGKESYPLLGFSGNNLDARSSAILTGTRQTNKGNSPSNVGNAFSTFSANSESRVWTYESNSKKIRSKWVNQGGIEVGSTILYEPNQDMFHLVTDAGAFMSRFSDAYEVELEIEE